MLLIGILLTAAIAGMSYFGSDTREKVMNEFCNIECKQNIQSKYKFCC